MVSFVEKPIRSQAAVRALLLLTTCGVALSCSSAVWAEEPDADAAYNAALTALNAKEYDHSIQLWTEAIQKRDHFADAYFNRGVTYQAENRLDKAIEDYTTVAQFKPTLVFTYLNRGFCYMHRMQYDEASADYTRVLELQPGARRQKESDALLGRADAYFYKGWYNIAIEDYQRFVNVTAASSDPDLKAQAATARRNIGLAYYGQKDYGHAAAAFDGTPATLPNPPKEVEAYLHDGAAFASSGDLTRGDFDRAIRDYEAAAALDPKDPRPHCFQALTLEKKVKLLSGDAAAQSLARRQAAAAFQRYLQLVPPTDPNVDTVKAHLEALKK